MANRLSPLCLSPLSLRLAPWNSRAVSSVIHYVATDLISVPTRARPESRLKRAMWIALITLCVIASAVAIRRMVALASPPKNAPAQFAGLDAAFAVKTVLTLTHIIPGLAFVVLVPFQFSRTFRNRHLKTHRWMGRALVILGLIIGVSAVPMSFHPIGGTLELSATLFWDALFLIFLTKAYLHARACQIAQHREWVIRAMSIALGIATVRPVMGAFFATSRLTGFTPHDFFGIAFWIGFTLTYLGGEMWIQHTRRVQAST
jgi:hypothetical protein